MGMFDNYKNIDNTDKPNNLHLFVEQDTQETIIIGGTADHSFTFDFKYSQVCDKYEVFYKQSIGDPIIHIRSTDFGAPTVTENDPEVGKSTLYIHLGPGDTEKFNRDRDTFAQIKLYMKDGTIIYGEKNEIIVYDTLEVK